jgi:PAS domain S-box-containing protein
MSLKYRLALTYAFVQLAILFIVFWQVTSQINETSFARFKEKADLSLNIVAELSLNALIINDLGDIQDTLDRHSTDGDVLKIEIVDATNRIIGSSDYSLLGEQRQSPPENKNFYWLEKDLRGGSRSFGKLFIQYSLTAVNSDVKSINRFAILISVLSIIAVFLISLLIANLLTRRLEHISKVSNSISNGDLDFKIDVDGNDEISHVGQALNLLNANITSQMLEIQNRETRYKNLFDNAETSIWNEDFYEVHNALNRLRQEGVTNLREYLKRNDHKIIELTDLISVTDVNQTTLKLFEIDTKAKLFDHIEEPFGICSREIAIDALSSIWDKKRIFRAETIFNSSSGKSISVIISFRIPETIEGFKNVPVSISDITERLKTEELFSVVFRDGPASYTISTPDIYNSKFIDVSENWLSTMGYSRDEIISNDPHDLNIWCDPDGRRLVIDKLKTVKHLQNFETKLRKKNGQEIDVSISARYIGVDTGRLLLFVLQDITEIKSLEKTLQREREQLDLANRVVGLGYTDQDMITKQFFWSDQLYRILGFEEERPEASQELFRSRIHPDDLQSVTDIYEKSFAEPGAHENEYRIVLPNGTVRQIHAIREFIRDENEQPIRFIGTIMDVTESRNREEQLRQAQKMESVGQLTGGLAHDFNNILAGLQGNLELIRQENTTKEEMYRRIDRATAIVRRGAKLTRHLLAFSRKQSLVTKSVNLRDLDDSTFDFMQRTLGESITLKSDFPPDLWSAEVDLGQLENAVLNLSINARDAMPQGGDLTFTAQNIQVDQNDGKSSHNLTTGDYIALAIQDTGTGIPANELDSVFEPFFTTKDVGQGSGLGLSMVFGFAQQSGGTVAIDSTVGIGTRVTLYLPRAQDKVTTPTDSDIKLPAEHDHSKRIMVIEDDPEVLEVITLTLNNMGYEVIEGGDGSNAINVSLAQDSSIDLLLTDVVLPNGINGPDMADAIVQIWGNMKVLLMSGYAQSEILRTTNEDLRYPLIQKPFPMEKLRDKVGEILTRV